MSENLTGMVNATEAANMLENKVSRQRIAELCRKDRVVGAKKVGKSWMIPLPVQIIPSPVGRPSKHSD